MASTVARRDDDTEVADGPPVLRVGEVHRVEVDSGVADLADPSAPAVGRVCDESPGADDPPVLRVGKGEVSEVRVPIGLPYDLMVDAASEQNREGKQEADVCALRRGDARDRGTPWAVACMWSLEARR